MIFIKKANNKGFLLVELLIVTTVVAGSLIFLYVQFGNIQKNYNQYYDYNSVENLYSLKYIVKYIQSDATFNNALASTLPNNSSLPSSNFFDITDCENFTSTDYCSTFFELLDIKSIIITYNNFSKDISNKFDGDFSRFINSINTEGEETYRMIVKFNNSSYATLRFEV